MPKLATLIKAARERRGWSQKRLAHAIGVTPGFITKLEAEEAFPSYERCIALANVLEVSLNNLWREVEKLRTGMFQQRIRTRGATVRGAIRTRGGPARGKVPPAGRERSADDIAREIAQDPDLQVAYRHLKLALADPELRAKVLGALEAYANAAEKGGS